MSSPPNPVAPAKEELEEKEGTGMVPLLSGEPVEDGLGQEKLYANEGLSNDNTVNKMPAYPGIIIFDHQPGFPIARKVASMSSSERPAIAFTALSTTLSDVWGWYCGVPFT